MSLSNHSMNMTLTHTYDVIREMIQGNDQLRVGFVSFKNDLMGLLKVDHTVDTSSTKNNTTMDITGLIDKHLGMFSGEMQETLKSSILTIMTADEPKGKGATGASVFSFLGFGAKQNTNQGQGQNQNQPTNDDKLDALIQIVNNMEKKMATFHGDFRCFREMTESRMADEVIPLSLIHIVIPLLIYLLRSLRACNNGMTTMMTMMTIMMVIGCRRAIFLPCPRHFIPSTCLPPLPPPPPPQALLALPR